MTQILSPSFAGGELSPLLHARVDLSKFQIGLTKCENFVVLPQGGVTRRPGLIRHEEWGTWSSTDGQCPVRLIPFSYATSDSMVLVFGDRSGKAISASADTQERGRVYRLDNGYSISDVRSMRFIQSGNVIFTAQKNHKPKMFTRTGGVGNMAFNESDLSYMNGPWSANDERDARLRVYRSNNELYVESNKPFFTRNASGENNDANRLFELNYSIPQAQVTWSGSGDGVSEWVEVGSEWYFRTTGTWTGTVTLQRLSPGKSPNIDDDWDDWRPHNRSNAQEVGNCELSGSEDELNVRYRIKASITSGSASVTLTSSGFTKTNTFEIHPAFYTEYKARVSWIQEYDDIDDEPILRDTYTADWRVGAWGKYVGYPSAVALYQDRLCLAGSPDEPQSIWMSRTGDYRDFGTTLGNLKDDDAISITLAAEDVSGIHSLYSGQDLLAFTSSSEWKIKGSGENGAITPTAITAHVQTKTGSAEIQPIEADGAVIYAQTHRGEIHTFKYSFELDGYAGTNLSILSEHLFHKGQEVSDIVYQKTPHSIIWCLRKDGTVATCTFQQEHQVAGWSRQKTDGVIGSICVVPRGDGYSELWAVVKRDDVWAIETLDRFDPMSTYYDNGKPYVSTIATLRLPTQSSEEFFSKKFTARLAIYAIDSFIVLAAPANDFGDKRWRPMTFPQNLSGDSMGQMQEYDLQLDTGFQRGNGVKLWIDDYHPLTIIAIDPEIAIGS